MTRLADIYFYPLKSARGIRLDSAELDDFGIRYDRRWMVVDDAGDLVTQREAPRMALVRTAVADGALTLEAPGRPALALPLDGRGTDGARRRVRVWDDLCDGADQGDAAAAWISGHLGARVRIVRMPDDVVRPIQPNVARAEGRVSFADAFPMLLISQESLDELNRRLDAPLPMNRFRPNVVTTGSAPHAEDGWRRIRIGAVECVVAKPCARCTVTTIDQDTAEKGIEPLRTLAAYRERSRKVLFGQNVAHRSRGRIAVGDAVEVLDR
jgi:uncharacterized protein YcbX